MGIVRPHLWFDDQAEQAAEHYVSVLPRSEVTKVVRAPAGVPGVPEGQAFVVEAVLDGQPVTLMNGGPTFRLDEAFSFVVECQDQDEVDRYWDALLAGGESRHGAAGSRTGSASPGRSCRSRSTGSCSGRTPTAAPGRWPP
ncbi:VOC family protein [Cellulomonas soli]